MSLFTDLEQIIFVMDKTTNLKIWKIMMRYFGGTSSKYFGYVCMCFEYLLNIFFLSFSRSPLKIDLRSILVSCIYNVDLEFYIMTFCFNTFVCLLFFFVSWLSLYLKMSFDMDIVFISGLGKMLIFFKIWVESVTSGVSIKDYRYNFKFNIRLRKMKNLVHWPVCMFILRPYYQFYGEVNRNKVVYAIFPYPHPIS
jgi:hypothetical protein